MFEKIDKKALETMLIITIIVIAAIIIFLYMSRHLDTLEKQNKTQENFIEYKKQIKSLDY